MSAPFHGANAGSNPAETPSQYLTGEMSPLSTRGSEMWFRTSQRQQPNADDVRILRSRAFVPAYRQQAAAAKAADNTRRKKATLISQRGLCFRLGKRERSSAKTQAHHVSISPQEDRGVSAGAVGEVEDAAGEGCIEHQRTKCCKSHP